MDLAPHVMELGDVTLRRFDREADLPELFEVIKESLEHLRPWMPWVAEPSLAKTAEFLARRQEAWDKGREFTYAIVLGGAVVGACQLFRRDDSPVNGREIGYWLHPAATGRGVATRAARALVDQGFRFPGVDYVEVVHDPANRASAAVPARLGFAEHLRRPAERPAEHPAERLAPARTGMEQVWRLTRHQADKLAAAETC
ncbi:GNAT family N-acetyltransferase [Streptomyces sp. NBC_01433]|uniref:GNAT family N-acetyltransferase n=1 Tax=Streptomyces sp. NBC_01433 TaxID=2903864 RepID=UPI002259B837|nr:GNAT family N-acetyltransferase [Streptomyces sp. NBC_01433]MCX4681855.1 GNAT family N-acetyltransferase [Streptomyces sp. NBC_01433]